MIAKVLIDNNVSKLNKVYDYFVKPEDYDKVEIGKRVLVNFGLGKGKNNEGIIVKLENIDSDKKLKHIEEILDEKSYLNENSLKLAKWMSKVYFCNVYTALKLMLPQSNTKLTLKKITGKQIKLIRNTKNAQVIEQAIEEKKITSVNHIRLLRQLVESKELEIDEVVQSLKISKNIIKLLKDKGYIEEFTKDVDLIDYSNFKKDTKLIPTDEQSTVINSLIDKINVDKFNVSLLFGVTGSGKTEVYLQAIEECLRLNKTAIVLVPEISLTAQTKSRFISRFGDIVSVMHSKMTVLEKQTEYKRIMDGRCKIVIGPRSALFAPLKNIGLIIIDEEHDTSYISQSSPKYNTKEVATRIAYMQNAVVLLGSATPDVCTMYKAKIGKIDYYELLSRPNANSMPEVEIVDMKQEALINKSKVLSNRLKEELEKNILNKEQSFIYLNRRGYSSYIVCNDCGKIIKCPNCDVSLTYHKKSDLLLCHYCSYCETKKETCPYCGGENLTQGGMGTEKIEKEILEQFPGIKIARMDMDTTIKKGSHEEILNNFKKDNIDVLVGTQMISKGHDIENVTLVGIINADGGAVSDYTDSEKNFSNLLQVAGRAGRGKKKGRVIMQATDTQNYVLDAVGNHSYLEFYNKEIDFRKQATYPPFIDILMLEIVGKDKVKVANETKKLYDVFSKTKNSKIQVYSPKTPYIGKMNNKYRMQIILKANIDNKVLDLVYENLNFYDKIKDRSVTVTVTKNPVKIG